MKMRLLSSDSKLSIKDTGGNPGAAYKRVINKSAKLQKNGLLTKDAILKKMLIKSSVARLAESI